MRTIAVKCSIIKNSPQLRPVLWYRDYALPVSRHCWAKASTSTHHDLCLSRLTFPGHHNRDHSKRSDPTLDLKGYICKIWRHGVSLLKPLEASVLALLYPKCLYHGAVTRRREANIYSKASREKGGSRGRHLLFRHGKLRNFLS